MQKHKKMAFVLMGLLAGWAMQANATDTSYEQLLPPFPPFPPASVADTTLASTSASSSLSGVSDAAIPVLTSASAETHSVAPSAPLAAESTQAASAAPAAVSPIKTQTPLPRLYTAKPKHNPRTTSKRQHFAGPAVSRPAKQAVQQSLAWANNPHASSTLGESGRVTFTYGDSAPTVICAPLRVCDIELEPGESVQGAPHIGDSVRWKVAPAISKENNQVVTHLIVKATEANLDTNLVVPTDRRTYHLRLVSTRRQYASRVSFEYPENNALAWQKIAQTTAKQEKTFSPSDFPSISVDQMHFNYAIKEVKGHPKFKPVRVMDDGTHTFVTMNDVMPVYDAPVLVLIGPDKEEQIVNYRLKGNIFIIDRMVDKLALISGTGKKQQRIEITRDACVAKGLFNRCVSQTASRTE